MKPIIKYRGGKSKEIQNFIQYIPNEYDRYVEPFIGGGAVLINILQQYDVKEAYAFDINKDLINCYNVIKENVEDLIKELEIKEKLFLELSMDDRPQVFYDIRKEYNSYKLDEERNVKRAAEFIFLNKTCFNGLYRVNKNGEFNVPCGKYKNPKICDAKNLRNLSKLIQNVNFEYGDFRKSNAYIDGDTFVYFDPPYRPLSTTSGFTSYTKEDFNDENQKDLAKYFKELDSKNAKLMLSNSNPKNTNKDDNFFEEIYKGFNINEISAKRMINSDAKGRGEISELLITNYEENNGCIQENSILKKVTLS